MLTTEEEKITKLVAADVKARAKLAIVNQAMGEKIRAEFKLIDEAIRADYEPILAPLEIAAAQAKADLKAEFE